MTIKYLSTQAKNYLQEVQSGDYSIVEILNEDKPFYVVVTYDLAFLHIRNGESMLMCNLYKAFGKYKFDTREEAKEAINKL